MVTAIKERFRWESSTAGDFPLYRDGGKRGLRGGLIVVLIAAILGIALDLYQNQLLEAMHIGSRWLELTVAVIVLLLVPGIIFAGFWYALDGFPRALFRKLHPRDFLLIAGLIILGYAYSFGMTFLLKAMGLTSVDDSALATSGGKRMSEVENIATLVELIFLLFGEELFGIAIFLVSLAVTTHAFKMERRPAVIVSWIVAGIVFGLAHFEAYDWHLAQMLLVIGGGHMIIQFGYLKTKNIWVSYLTHFLYDGIVVMASILADL